MTRYRKTCYLYIDADTKSAAEAAASEIFDSIDGLFGGDLDLGVAVDGYAMEMLKSTRRLG